MNKVRKMMSEHIYNTYKLLDPTLENFKLMEEKFESLSDKEFFQYMDELTTGEYTNFRYYVKGYDESDGYLKLDNVEKALNYLEEPLFERITLPHIHKDAAGKPMMSKEKFMVIPCHVNVLRQMIKSEGKVAHDEDEVDGITGVVRKGSKGGTYSATVMQAMQVRDTGKILNEFITHRSDDSTAKTDMINEIINTGTTQLSDKTITKSGQSSKNYVNEIMYGMMLASDLVEDI